MRQAILSAGGLKGRHFRNATNSAACSRHNAVSRCGRGARGLRLAHWRQSFLPTSAILSGTPRPDSTRPQAATLPHCQRIQLSSRAPAVATTTLRPPLFAIQCLAGGCGSAGGGGKQRTMSDRAALFLFSIFMIVVSLAAAVWLFITGQAGTVDGLFLVLTALLSAAVFALYVKFVIGRAMEAQKPAPVSAAKAAKVEAAPVA